MRHRSDCHVRRTVTGGARKGQDREVRIAGAKNFPPALEIAQRQTAGLSSAGAARSGKLIERRRTQVARRVAGTSTAAVCGAGFATPVHAPLSGHNRPLGSQPPAARATEVAVGTRVASRPPQSGRIEARSCSQFIKMRLDNYESSSHTRACQSKFSRTDKMGPALARIG